MIQLVLHLAQVKIKAVFNVLHSHTLLCLKFPDVKSFPRPQQERIARTNNLNWQHHQVAVWIMARYSKMSAHWFQCSLGKSG